MKRCGEKMNAFILIVGLFLILALIGSYLLIYPSPKKMVVEFLKKKTKRVSLLTQTNFIVFMTILSALVILSVVYRYSSTQMVLVEWLGLLGFLLLFLFIFAANHIYKDKLEKKVSHLIRSTTDYTFNRKKKQTSSLFYISLVTINILIVVTNVVICYQSEEMSFIDMINISLSATIVFVYLFYLFGLLDTYTELSNLENVKLERISDVVEGIVFLETNNDLFIKQVDTSEIIIVNKNLTEVISYTSETSN